MTMSLLDGKVGIVFGVANKRSIAWAIAQAWAKAGAKLAFTYQGERLKENVEELAGTFGSDTLLIPCDVTKDADIDAVFAQVGQKFGKLHLIPIGMRNMAGWDVTSITLAMAAIPHSQSTSAGRCRRLSMPNGPQA